MGDGRKRNPVHADLLGDEVDLDARVGLDDAAEVLLGHGVLEGLEVGLDHGVVRQLVLEVPSERHREVRQRPLLRRLEQPLSRARAEGGGGGKEPPRRPSSRPRRGPRT